MGSKGVLITLWAPLMCQYCPVSQIEHSNPEFLRLSQPTFYMPACFLRLRLKNALLL